MLLPPPTDLVVPAPPHDDTTIAVSGGKRKREEPKADAAAKGMPRKCQLCQAMLQDPSLVICSDCITDETWMCEMCDNPMPLPEGIRLRICQRCIDDECIMCCKQGRIPDSLACYACNGKRASTEECIICGAHGLVWNYEICWFCYDRISEDIKEGHGDLWDLEKHQAKNLRVAFVTNELVEEEDEDD